MPRRSVRQRPGVRVDDCDERGDEAIGILERQRGVGRAEDRAGLELLQRRDADRLTDCRHQHGRIETLAGDVADRERQLPVRERERVVPVAADAHVLRRGGVHGIERKPVDPGQRLRQRGTLERVDDALLPAIVQDVVVGERDAFGEDLRDPQVVRVTGRPVRTAQQQDRAAIVVARPERDGDRAREIKRLTVGEVPRIVRRRSQFLGAQPGPQFATIRGDRRRDGIVRPHRIPSRELGGFCGAFAVGVGDRRGANRTVGVAHVDHAQVGDRVRAELRDVGEEPVVVAGSPHDLARLRQERQRGGGARRLAFEAFARLDVDHRAEPVAHCALGVADGDAARDEPAVRSVGRATDPQLVIQIRPVVHRGVPVFDGAREIVGVHDRTPRLQRPGLLEIEPGILRPARVDVVEQAVRTRDPDELRRRIGEVAIRLVVRRHRRGDADRRVRQGHAGVVGPQRGSGTLRFRSGLRRRFSRTSSREPAYDDAAGSLVR